MHTRALVRTGLFMFVCVTIAGPRPAGAQIGSGWSERTYTRKIHLDNEAGLQTFNWSAYQSVCTPICADYRYDAATDTETFRLIDNRTNRSEIRLQNEYSTGRRQFQGYVTIFSPLDDESLMQIFGSTSGATLSMMRGYAADGGSIRTVGGDPNFPSGSGTLATGVYGVEQRINVIHDQNNFVEYYVNGSLRKRFQENEQVANYWKYGAYGTLRTAGATVRWRQVRLYEPGGGTSPTPTPTPSPTQGPTATPTPTRTPAGAFIEITPGGSAVTASTNDGNVPANSVDDNVATRWSANGDGQWIRYDLGSVRTVAHVTIAFFSGDTRQSRFDLQTSDDGQAWTTVLANRSSSGTSTQEEAFDLGVSARYVRYLGHGNSANLWNSLTEVSLFTPSGSATPTSTPLPTDTPSPTPTATPTPTPTLAPPTPVEVAPIGAAASTSDINVAAGAIDNDLGTRWSGSGDGAWLQIDLGATRRVAHVRVAAYNGNQRRNRFDVQVSTNGTTWTNVLANAQTNGTSTAEQTFDFPDADARWVRYVGHGATVNTGGTSTWNSVTEVSVFAVP